MILEESVAYFSMEVGLNHKIPTYSGGLGVLAGDTVKTFADLKINAVCVTLLHRKGYLFQKLTLDGWQMEEGVKWNPENFLKKLKQKVIVNINGRDVIINAWSLDVKSPVTGFVVKIFFLDTEDKLNKEEDKYLTHYLYGGDDDYRLSQEIVLGIGGVKLLRTLGYTDFKKYHLNEGHSAFLIIELYEELRTQKLNDVEIFKILKEKLVFTTHTPVKSGHDVFKHSSFLNSLKGYTDENVLKKFFTGNNVDLTKMCLKHAGYVNAVSKKHAEVTKKIFPNHKINYITNGVHNLTWTNAFFKKLYDKYLPNWVNDCNELKKVSKIPDKEFLKARKESKMELINFVNDECNAGFDEKVLTIGFARRITSYKRPLLLINNLEKLEELSEKINGLQIIFGGKTHPRDYEGKELIKKIFNRVSHSKKVKICFLKNYDIKKGLKLVSGVDVWLNNPKPPLEASGTSGMKAVFNGVPNLSVLDGWWIEGYKKDVTGWGFKSVSDFEDEKILREIIEKEVFKVFSDEKKWVSLSKNVVKNNASFFNTQRMVKEYLKAYSFN